MKASRVKPSKGPYQTAISSSLPVSSPKPQPVRPGSAHAEPLVEQHQVVPARAPTKRPPYSHGMEIDQKEMRSILFIESKQDIAGMEIIVTNAGIMHAANEC